MSRETRKEVGEPIFLAASLEVFGSRLGSSSKSQMTDCKGSGSSFEGQHRFLRPIGEDNGSLFSMILSPESFQLTFTFALLAK